MGQLGWSHDYPTSKEPSAGFSSSRPQATVANPVAPLQLRAPGPLPIGQPAVDSCRGSGRRRFGADDALLPREFGTHGAFLPREFGSHGALLPCGCGFGANGAPLPTAAPTTLPGEAQRRLAADAGRRPGYASRSGPHRRPGTSLGERRRRRRPPDRDPARLATISGQRRRSIAGVSVPASDGISPSVAADVLPRERRPQPHPATISAPAARALDMDATTVRPTTGVPHRAPIAPATPRHRAAPASHPHAQRAQPVAGRRHAVSRRRSHHSGRPHASADCCPAPGTRVGRSPAGRAGGISAYVPSTAREPGSGPRTELRPRANDLVLLERPDDAPLADRAGWRLDAGSGVSGGSRTGMTASPISPPRRNTASSASARQSANPRAAALRNARRLVRPGYGLPSAPPNSALFDRAPRSAPRLGSRGGTARSTPQSSRRQALRNGTASFGPRRSGSAPYALIRGSVRVG